MTIYTDSGYAFGAVHEFRALWHERGFITSSGARVRNGAWIVNLLVNLQTLIKHDIMPGSSSRVIDCDKNCTTSINPDERSELIQSL